MGAVRRDEREGEERGKYEPCFISLTHHFNFVVKPHTQVVQNGMVSNEAIENIELFVVLKIENWPTKSVGGIKGGG